MKLFIYLFQRKPLLLQANHVSNQTLEIQSLITCTVDKIQNLGSVHKGCPVQSKEMLSKTT